MLAEFDLDHTEEVKRWILSFGRHAVVLEPQQLRTELAEEVSALHDVYSRPDVMSVEGKQH